MTQRPILVLGGTGKSGSRVAAQLRRRDVPVRVAARSAEHTFDWQREETWAAALDGVDAVYLVPLDGTSLTSAFVERAVDTGVRRIVLLSARGVDIPGYYGENNPATDSHLDGERAVRASGIGWTILRPGWFAQNFSEGMFLEQVLAGELRLPTGDGACSFIDTEDLAAVAAAALVEDGHAGVTYELSGPRALSCHEAVGEIAKQTGSRIRYVPVSEDDYVAELVRSGMTAGDAKLVALAIQPIRRGLESRIADGVPKALGREARDFADYVNSAVAAGAWR